MEIEFDDRLIKVGFWKTEGRAKLPFSSGNMLYDMFLGVFHAAIQTDMPSVFDFVDDDWDAGERRRVLTYISNPEFRKTAYFGTSTCRVCGKENGCADFSDGKFIWPEGLAHYVRDHAVRPLPRFTSYALRRVPR